MGIIKIDFDNYAERIDLLRECLDTIPKPLFVRISSGGKGIHVISFHNDDKDYREKFDDPKRLEIDRIRERDRLINNLLANVKYFGSERKVAGEWIKIKNKKDCERFIKERLKVMKEYNFKCDKCGGIRTMKAKDITATIGHPNCGIYRYHSELNSSTKPIKSRVVASKPFEPKLDNSKLIETNIEISPYFHPKIDLIEKYRCDTCYEQKKCPKTFREKTWCLIDFKFKTLTTANSNVEGVLSRDPSEFEIIELYDIKQKINVYDIVRLIINRDDKYSMQNVDANDPTKDTFPDKNRTLTYDIIVKSLKGEITIGTRPINPKNNTIKWIVWDVDKEHNKDPRAIVDAIIKYLKEWYGLTGYIELSGSIDSYHVWIFTQEVNNNIAYDFDQNFRTRLKSIGIGLDPKSIERGVQLGDGGMIKLPYNIQRKEKYGHKGGRSRFIVGVDLSKITPEKLSAPWGNLSTEFNTFQPAKEEKIEPHKVNNIVNEIFNSNEKVNGMLKCNNCPKEMLVAQKNIIDIINFIKNPHKCGGKISFGISTFETSVEILKTNTDSVETFCNRLIDSPNKKTYFDFEIRETSNEIFENTLILKTKSEKEGKELAGWITNSAALKGKLHQPAPHPFRVEKVFDFSFDLANMYGKGV